MNDDDKRLRIYMPFSDKPITNFPRNVKFVSFSRALADGTFQELVDELLASDDKEDMLYNADCVQSIGKDRYSGGSRRD